MQPVENSVLQAGCIQAAFVRYQARCPAWYPVVGGGPCDISPICHRGCSRPRFGPDSLGPTSSRTDAVSWGAESHSHGRVGTHDPARGI